HDDRNSFGFPHDQPGGGGELIGDSENGGLQGFARAVALAAEIAQHAKPGSAYGDIGESDAPGTAEGVADDNGDATTGVAGESAGPLAARGLRPAGGARERVGARHG